MAPSEQPRGSTLCLWSATARTTTASALIVHVDGGHKAVRNNMIPGMRAYQVVNRGIQACDEGILGHT
eukprot:COSAG06_NODE_3022_length_5949_cov_8.542051_1_plen_68_part_00